MKRENLKRANEIDKRLSKINKILDLEKEDIIIDIGSERQEVDIPISNVIHTQIVDFVKGYYRKEGQLLLDELKAI